MILIKIDNVAYKKNGTSRQNDVAPFIDDD